MAEPVSKNPLEQLVPLLMLASPLLELAKPGVGVGMYKGVLEHQQRTQDRRQNLVFSLAKDLGNMDESQVGMVKEALKAQGLSPEDIDAAISLSRVYRDPNAQAKRQLEQVISEDVPGLGSVTGTRGDVQNIRIGQARHTQGVAERQGEITAARTARQQEIDATRAAQEQDRTRTAATGRVNEVQRAISQVMLDPRVPPQLRARALALYRLSQKPDADAESLAANAEAILNDATTAIGQVPKTPSTAKERVLQKIERGEKLTPGEQEIKKQEIDRAADQAGAVEGRAIARETRAEERRAAEVVRVRRQKLEDEFKNAETEWRQANAEFVAASRSGDSKALQTAERKQAVAGAKYQQTREALRNQPVTQTPPAPSRQPAPTRVPTPRPTSDPLKIR